LSTTQSPSSALAPFNYACISYQSRPPPRPPLFPYTTLFRSGIPLLAGRPFNEDDWKTLNLVINENMARRYWPQGSALGKRVNFRSEEHTSELQSLAYLVCRLLLEKKNTPGRMSRRRSWNSSP